MSNLKKHWIVYLIVLIVSAAVVCWAIYLVKSNQKKSEIAVPLTSVTTTQIGYHIIPTTVSAYGTTVSPNSVDLKAQVPGTIRSIDFKAGQHVKQGQLLFTLITSGIDNQARRLRAEMLTAKSNYDRLLKMNNQLPGSVAAFTLEKARLMYKQILVSYEESLITENIKSPINGIISDTNLAIGNYVNPGLLLAQIVDPDSLELQYQLPSRFINQVRKGQLVEFYPNGQPKPYLAHVVYISPLLDKNDYNLTLRAKFKQHTILPQNLFGRAVQIIDPTFKAISIPQYLVQTDPAGFYVYTIENHKIAKSYFKPGDVSKEGFIQVLSGFKVNTSIVSSKLSSLEVGQKVRVQNK